MKILFLEDDILLNEIIQEHLENEGYSVKSTFTGYEAEELIYSEKFDLFLFDVNVPGMPIGSPGMEQGNTKQAYNILYVNKDGSTGVYESH